MAEKHRTKSSVIEDSCQNTNFQYSEDHPMKLVLLNGLRRKSELCDEQLLRQLLSNKGFQMNEVDNYAKLLEKIRQNLTVFTVTDLHNILKIPKPTVTGSEVPLNGNPPCLTMVPSNVSIKPSLTQVPPSYFDSTCTSAIANLEQTGPVSATNTAFKFMLPSMNMDNSFNGNLVTTVPTEVTAVIYQSQLSHSLATQQQQQQTSHGLASGVTTHLQVAPSNEQQQLMTTSVNYRNQRPKSQESDHGQLTVDGIATSSTRKSIVAEVTDFMRDRLTTETDLTELIGNLEDLKKNIQQHEADRVEVPNGKLQV